VYVGTCTCVRVHCVISSSSTTANGDISDEDSSQTSKVGKSGKIVATSGLNPHGSSGAIILASAPSGSNSISGSFDISTGIFHFQFQHLVVVQEKVEVFL